MLKVHVLYNELLGNVLWF